MRAKLDCKETTRAMIRYRPYLLNYIGSASGIIESICHTSEARHIDIRLLLFVINSSLQTKTGCLQMKYSLQEGMPSIRKLQIQ